MTGGAVRSAARAVILDGTRILVAGYRDAEGPWYVLPGGGQNPGESLSECCRRECLEELGLVVDVGNFIGLREVLRRNGRGEVVFHQVEHLFLCRVVGDGDPAKRQPDPGQEGGFWLEAASLVGGRFWPQEVLALAGPNPPTLPIVVASHL